MEQLTLRSPDNQIIPGIFSVPALHIRYQKQAAVISPIYFNLPKEHWILQLDMVIVVICDNIEPSVKN